MGIQKIFDVEGQAHFTTINLYKRFPLLEDYEFCDLIIENLKYYREKFQFKLLGYVILPDHFHMIVLPRAGARYSDIIRDFKKGVAFAIIGRLSSSGNQSLLDRFLLKPARRDGQRYSIWQRKYFDFNIFSEKKFVGKLEYIHDNPVVLGLAKAPGDWRYSSWRNYHLGDSSIISVDELL